VGLFYKHDPLTNVIVKNNSLNFIVKISLAEGGKSDKCHLPPNQLAESTSRQPRWQKVLPANPDGRKFTTLTRGAITTIAGLEIRDFPPTGMAEGYFPLHRMVGRHMSLSPPSVRPVLIITFEESYF
jgi:hypothetical protein